MLLTVNDLPSGGYLGGASILNISPLNFLEVLEYTNMMVDTPIKRYVRDIKFLARDSKTVFQHSLYDLDYLIFMMKAHTISEDLDFSAECTCNTCKKSSILKLSLKDLQFNNITEETKLPKYVVISGVKYQVKVPTIETFVNVMDKYNLYQKVSDVDIIKLISLFPEFESNPNEIERAVFNASREDIAVFQVLENLMLTPVKPVVKKCVLCDDERGMVIRIDSLITNMFREILLNNSAVESKIQFE